MGVGRELAARNAALAALASCDQLQRCNERLREGQLLSLLPEVGRSSLQATVISYSVAMSASVKVTQSAKALNLLPRGGSPSCSQIGSVTAPP